MAHAGTLQQPAKTGSGRPMALWLALIATAVVVAIGFAIVAPQLNIGSNAAAPVDRTYDQVERLRGGAVLPGAVSIPAGPTQMQFTHAPGKGQLEFEDGYKIQVAPGGVSIAPTGTTQSQFGHAPGKGPLR